MSDRPVKRLSISQAPHSLPRTGSLIQDSLEIQYRDRQNQDSRFIMHRCIFSKWLVDGSGVLLKCVVDEPGCDELSIVVSHELAPNEKPFSLWHLIAAKVSSDTSRNTSGLSHQVVSE